MSPPLVSIVVPIYNVEKYLSACLQSISNQTYRNFECLCINDGSEDHSAEIANIFCQENNRFTLINQVNQGLAAARNHGINAAAGDYLFFVDSDDLLHPEAIEYCVTLARQYESDFVCCEYKNVPENTAIEETSNASLSSAGLFITDQPLLALLDKRAPIKTSAVIKLYSSKLLKQIQFDEKRLIHEDTLFALEILNRATKLVYSGAVIYYYRNRPGSLMTAKNYEHSLRTLSDLVITSRHSFQAITLMPQQESVLILESGLEAFSMVAVDLALNPAMARNEKERLCQVCGALLREIKKQRPFQYRALPPLLRLGLIVSYEMQMPHFFFALHKALLWVKRNFLTISTRPHVSS